MGFAQEMKDFVGAYQTTYDTGIKGKAQRTSEEALKADTEYKNANLEISKEELRLRKEAQDAASKLAGVEKPMTAYQKRYLDLKEREVAAAEAKAAATADATAADTLAGGIDLDGYSLGEEDTGTGAYTGGYARGGAVVKQYAVGGAPVANAFSSKFGSAEAADPNASMTAAAPATAIPTAPATGAIPPLNEPIPAAKKPATGLPTYISLAPKDKEALNQVAKKYTYDATRPTAALGQASSGQYTPKGVKATEEMSFQELDFLGKTIDPNGEMAQSAKSAAVFGLAFTTQKNPESKFKLAYGVLGALDKQARTLASLIPEALQNGHANEVCRLFNDACARFPTGHEVKVVPTDKGFAFSVLDEKGKEVEKGELSPEQLLQASGAIANGSAFVDQVGKFFGENKKTQGSYESALGFVSDAYTALAAAKKEYDRINGSGASVGDKEDAYADYKTALDAAKAAENDARRLAKGTKGANPASDIRAARAVDPNSVVDPVDTADRPEEGAFTDALSGVTKAASDWKAAKDALDLVAGTPEAAAATKAVNAAYKAFTDAQGAARSVFGELDRGKTNAKDWEASFNNSLTNAIQAGMNSNMPTAIPETSYAPVDDRNGLQKILPTWLGGKEDPTQAIPTTETPAVTPSGNTLKPPPANVLANAKAAIAGGADRDAVIKRITDAGFSAEGL